MSLPWTTPCWVQTLWLSLLAHSACSYNLICATWNFTLVVWSVMVLWVATNGAVTKPRAYCGRPTQGCAAQHALVSRFLVMIHCRTTPMCYFHVSSSLVISPYLIRISLHQTKSSRASFWSCKEDNLWRTGHWHDIGRIQEVVHQWLCLTVTVMTSAI